MQHIPVLLNEVIEALNIKPDGFYVDGTLGGGGHSAEILSRLSENGFLLGIDRDDFALNEAKKRLSNFGERFLAVKGIYPDVVEILKEHKKLKVDGLLLDLGFSSFQIDDPQRGFSFQNDGPLDMRMNPSGDESTAADVVNDLDEIELKEIFQNFGEERFAGRIARNLVQMRSAKAFQTTKELAQAIEKSVPPQFRYGRIHPATRVFQALRIVVNRELECLDRFLALDFSFLNSGARLAIISFHSLEDRKVKWAFKQCDDFKIITKKPLEAGLDEQQANPRARSAKLRVFERI